MNIFEYFLNVFLQIHIHLQKNIAYVTKHVVSSLSAMLEDDSILQRLKEFCDHMNLYPNERHHAIKVFIQMS